MKIGISACLAGDSVRYDGRHKKDDILMELLKGHEIVKICPEMESGFTVPRDTIELTDGKAVTKNGKDVSDELSEGSGRCLEMIIDCDFVILKSRSPSCGYGFVYDGTFSGKLIDGNGVFAKMCIGKGIRVFTELDLDRIEKELK